jgi:hypothetical protein
MTAPSSLRGSRLPEVCGLAVTQHRTRDKPCQEEIKGVRESEAEGRFMLK